MRPVTRSAPCDTGRQSNQGIGKDIFDNQTQGFFPKPGRSKTFRHMKIDQLADTVQFGVLAATLTAPIATGGRQHCRASERDGQNTAANPDIQRIGRRTFRYDCFDGLQAAL